MNHQHLPVIILFFLNCERADFQAFLSSYSTSQSTLGVARGVRPRFSYPHIHNIIHACMQFYCTHAYYSSMHMHTVSTTSTHNNRVGVGVEYELVCIILLYQSMYQIVCKCILCIRHYTSLVCICHLRARNVILLYSHTSQYINNILSLYFITTLEQLKYACSSTNTTLEWLYF